MSQQQNPLLSKERIQSFAAELGVEYCTVKAVIEVETGGKPFLTDGRPLILFEGHIFWRELNRLALNPESFACSDTADILYRTWTKKHYKGGAGEYERLQRAITINQEAAYRSASWGLFQIMGFNCELCGEPDINEFVRKQESLESQLTMAAAFIKSAGHTVSLARKDWASFARRYNGPAYAENDYDGKLRRAHEKCLSESRA